MSQNSYASRETNFKRVALSSTPAMTWSEKAGDNFVIDKNIFLVLLKDSLKIPANGVLLRSIVF
jgi:hypothetical protein